LGNSLPTDLAVSKSPEVYSLDNVSEVVLGTAIAHIYRSLVSDDD